MALAGWPAAFALTCAVEVPLVVALTRDLRAPPIRRVALALVAQVATHPLVWFAFPRIAGLTGFESFALSELFAWLAEAALYRAAWRDVGWARAIAASALANGCSIGAGLALV